jgi:hypothetical protein
MSYEDRCTCDEEAIEPHSCPFAVEIHGADEDEEHCTCCTECSYQCAMDI